MTALMLQEKRTDYLYKTLEEDFFDMSVADKPLQRSIQRRLTYIRKLTWIHLITSSSFVFLFILFPFIDMPEGTKRLPVLLWTPFDTNPTPVHETVFLILSLNFYLSIVGNVMFDFLFLYVAQHLSVQFMLLEELMINLTQDLMVGFGDIEKYYSSWFQEQIYKRMSVCTRQHTILLQFGNEFEKFSSTVLGFQFVASYAAIAFGGYTLTMNHDDLIKSGLLLILTSSVTVQLTIFALHGTDLQERSTAVADAIYQSEWYLYQTSTRKCIYFILMNSRRGVKLTSAGLAPVNNEILVDIYQKAFSTIALLRSL